LVRERSNPGAEFKGAFSLIIFIFLKQIVCCFTKNNFSYPKISFFLSKHFG
jgi:hypothetical protein